MERTEGTAGRDGEAYSESGRRGGAIEREKAGRGRTRDGERKEWRN